MKRDIEARADIELLITNFYDKVKADAVLGYIFTDIAKVNWETHLPVMFDFWENTLFYTGAYAGNPIISHKHLHQLIPLNADHFRRWIFLFATSVDELFEGEKAELAKQRAKSIATVMQIKIIQDIDHPEN